MKILVVHPWGIGDWLCFTPVLRALHRSFGTSLAVDVLLLTPGTRAMVGMYEEIHRVEVLSPPNRIADFFFGLQSSRKNKYDWILFSAGIKSWKADLLAGMLRAKRKTALRNSRLPFVFLTGREKFAADEHFSANNMKLLREIGIPEDLAPRYPYLPGRLEMFQSDLRDGSLFIHPGCDAKSAYRRWPVDGFLEVCREWLDSGRRVTVGLGPGEEDMAPAFDVLKGREGFALCLRKPLTEVIRDIGRHDLFLNSDSGLGHVAAALGRRVVCIFGPGNPRSTAPLVKSVRLIISEKFLACRPCVTPGGRFGCVPRPCLNGISAKRVLEALSEMSAY